MKLISWNVNGLRAIHKKDALIPFITEFKPDILCLQETRADPHQLPDELRTLDHYHSYFASSTLRKGYSGVALYSKIPPKEAIPGFGFEIYDREGRTIVADYGRFVLINVYFPNGGASEERLRFKLDFYDEFLSYLDRLKKLKKKIIICGDVNTAHTEIDLSRPKENENNTGFLPEERAWIDRLISHDFIDTFRMFTKDSGHYTWWDMKTRSRERNVGWRLDYFFVSENLRKDITSSFILPDVTGSDHCPVGLEIDV